MMTTVQRTSRSAEEIERSILTETTRRAKEIGAVPRVEDPELARVRANFVTEIAREATDDRVAMLLAAAVEMAFIDGTTEELSRVERTLRDLDPSDARELHRLANAVATKIAREHHASRTTGDDARKAAYAHADAIQRFRFWSKSKSRLLLEPTACIAIIRTTFDDTVAITPRGQLLLKALRAWLGRAREHEGKDTAPCASGL